MRGDLEDTIEKFNRVCTTASRSIKMSVKYFSCNNILFLFNPKEDRIYRFSKNRWEPADDLEIRRKVRFHSVEITPGMARSLAGDSIEGMKG